MAVGDIDNSGKEIIFGTNGWEKPKAYSATLKSELWEIDNTDICSVNIANVDDDPQLEILVGECQWGSITVYDAINGAPNQQAKWSSQDHSSISITSGDTDNDGSIEIVWGTGITSTGEDRLVIANNDSGVEWSNNAPSQLDYFQSAGWIAIEPNDEQAVFIAPKTDSGYGGNRVITMNRQGELSISDEISSNADKVKDAVVIDYNKDGYGDIFMATADIYSGDFQVKQINNNSLLWGGSQGTYDNTIGAIMSFDVNDDSFEDAIYVDNGKVNVIDIYNRSSIWTSTTFSGGVMDLAAIPQKEGLAKIVIAANNDLSIWKPLGNTYIREYSASISCSRIHVSDINDDLVKEIICLKEDRYSRKSSSNFSVFDTQLLNTSNFTTQGKVTDFIPSHSNLLLATDYMNSSYGYYDQKSSELSLVSGLTGKLVRKSNKLVGSIPSRSLHLIPLKPDENSTITFSSKDVMYISN